MDTHNRAERPAATGYGTVPDPTDPEAWVNAGVAEDIKDALADVVLAGLGGAPPNETYRMTAATLADVFRRVLIRLDAPPPYVPIAGQRAAARPRVRARHAPQDPPTTTGGEHTRMRIRLTGTAHETERAAAALSGVLNAREVSPFYPNRPPSLLGRVYLDAEPPTTTTTDIDRKDTNGWSA